jgi:hypothetical protein
LIDLEELFSRFFLKKTQRFDGRAIVDGKQDRQLA